MRTIEKVFSENLRKLRGALTQPQLAELMEVPFSTYKDWEYGKKIPQAAQRKKIADFYKIPETALYLDAKLVKPASEQALYTLKSMFTLEIIQFLNALSAINDLEIRGSVLERATGLANTATRLEATEASQRERKLK